MVDTKFIIGILASVGTTVVLLFSATESCIGPAAPAASETGQDPSQDSQQPAGFQRFFNLAFVSSWSFEGSWSDLAGPHGSLKESVGSGPHAVFVSVNIEGPIREYSVGEGAIVGLWGDDIFLVDNSGHADPFSPEWTGTDSLVHVMSGGGAALTSPTVYNWAKVVSVKMEGTCAGTITVVPSGTKPLGGLSVGATVPPNLEAGDKYQLCDAGGSGECTVGVELDSGRCFDHSVNCHAAAVAGEPGYWHRDVSTDDLTVTGSRERVECD